jgi:ADP-ribose pyrophosphatase YjhB (NUDIX family)
MKPPLPPAQQIALWADQLRDMSAAGLRFSKDIYDQERYEALQDLAIAMFALATATTAAEIEPLRATILARPTPFTTGDAAIINDSGEMLLIQRADNHHWAMPGGALAVGETPAEGVVREALEETGVASQPLKLVGVYDSRYCGSVTAHQLYHFVFLCQPLPNAAIQESPSHGHEVLAIGWFNEANLPTNLDPGHISRIPDAFRAWEGEPAAYFDR